MDNVKNLLPRERLKIYQEELGYSDFRMSQLCGCSQPAYSKYMREGATIGKVIFGILEHESDLNANWLIRGTGEMLISEERARVQAEALKNCATSISQTVTGDASTATQHVNTSEVEALRNRCIQLERENAVLEYRLQENKDRQDMQGSIHPALIS